MRLVRITQNWRPVFSGEASMFWEDKGDWHMVRRGVSVALCLICLVLPFGNARYDTREILSLSVLLFIGCVCRKFFSGCYVQFKLQSQWLTCILEWQRTREFETLLGDMLSFCPFVATL